MSRAETTLDSPVGALSVVRATANDARWVRGLRDNLAEWMVQRGIRQWQPGELPPEWIELCIAQGSVYVVSHRERPIGSVTVVWDDPLIWGVQPEPAGYIHMLMVDRHFGSHGIGRSLLHWAEDIILESARNRARLDCVKDNEKLRSYYEDAGYRFVAEKTFPDIEWARATCLYEKPVTA